MLLARILLGIVVVVGACSGTGGSAKTTASAPPASNPGASAPSTAPARPTAPPHVFVIVMENRSFDEAMSGPYTAGLARQYAVATNYHAVAHPSLPNYLALTSGSTFGITDDGYHRLPAGGIGAQLSGKGMSWRAYMEGMTSGCFDSPSPYALKHNPFAYYGGACPANVVPMTELAADLAGATPSFVWITPNLCHDGHDCSTSQADDFLSGLVPQILSSPAWQQGGLLFITWDEDDGSSGNRVLTLVIAKGLTQHQTVQSHDHYSLLATVEDRLGVPRLGQAQGASPFNELFA